jgi:hypothetical protein
VRKPALVLVLLVVLSLAPPAAAGVAIRGLDASDFPTVRLTLISTRPVSVKPALAESGRPVVALEAQNLGHSKAVELVLDRSQSMSGSSLADALAAARTFIRLKEPGDQLGLIAFGRDTSEQAELSGSTGDLSAELGAMRVDASPGTALYAAAVEAARALRSESLEGRVIVLLTDGRNIAAGATLTDAVNAARKATALV